MNSQNHGPLGLTFDRRANGVFQWGVIIGMGAQRTAQISHVLLTKAEIDFTGAGDPHPVAAFAEIMAAAA